MYKFEFPNSKNKDVPYIKEAFSEHNMEVVDVSWECFGMWTWALLSNGELWCLDKSHGGGGYFARDSR
jgi:hypothetical protein